MFKRVKCILSVILSELFLISCLCGCSSFERLVTINQDEGVQGVLYHVSGSEMVVLMIGGSGPVDVDYTVSGIGLYAEMAEIFAESKISTLRLEKRSQFETIDEEYIEDGLLAIEYCKERYDHVFLLGHSLGAHVAPVFSESVDGLVLMGGFVSEVEEVYASQLKQNASVDQMEVIDDELNTILNLCEDTGFSWFGIRESWWLSLDELKLKSRLKGLDCPVLVVFSKDDERVHLDEYELYQSYLSLHEDTEFELVEGVNHFFVENCSGQFRESVVQKIATWILKQSSVIINVRCCE